MKIAITTAAVVGGLLLTAGTASAASSYQCQQYAQAQADAYAPNGQGAVAGGLVGALGGAAIAGITGGNAGTGAIVGGVGGAVVGGTMNQQKRKEVYDNAYWSCMNKGGPAPQPIYAPVPAGSAMVKQTANLRSTPEVNPYNIVGQLPGGAVVPVTSCNGYGWCTVALAGGGSAWVSQSLLRFGG
jgi:hypothetical protein